MKDISPLGPGYYDMKPIFTDKKSMVTYKKTKTKSRIPKLIP